MFGCMKDMYVCVYFVRRMFLVGLYEEHVYVYVGCTCWYKHKKFSIILISHINIDITAS